MLPERSEALERAVGVRVAGPAHGAVCGKNAGVVGPQRLKPGEHGDDVVERVV